MTDTLCHASEVEPERLQKWQDSSGREITAQIAPHLWQYVDALGTDCTVEFLLAFGGAPVHVSDRPNGSRAEKFLGREALTRLAGQFGGTGYIRVPTGTDFIIRGLRGQGMGIFDIARLTRRTDATVRKLLSEPDDRSAPASWDAVRPAKKRRPKLTKWNGS